MGHHWKETPGTVERKGRWRLGQASFSHRPCCAVSCYNTCKCCCFKKTNIRKKQPPALRTLCRAVSSLPTDLPRALPSLGNTAPAVPSEPLLLPRNPLPALGLSMKAQMLRAPARLLHGPCTAPARLPAAHPRAPLATSWPSQALHLRLSECHNDTGRNCLIQVCPPSEAIS